MHTDSAALPCPVCGTSMTRVTSHDQCPQCGFILPCCDGDAVLCADVKPIAPEHYGSGSGNDNDNSDRHHLERNRSRARS